MQSTHPDAPSSPTSSGCSTCDFTHNPALLMKFFHSKQQLRDCINAEIYNQIRDCIHLIDDKFRVSSDVAGYFLNILRGNEVGRILRQMHELEILDRYIPEFGAIKNLVRHEEYHQYAVDEHTLVAIENLDESTLSTIPNSGHFMEMLRGLQKPELLRLALLLHDIGVGIKGPGGHEDKSLRAAKAVLERSGILDEADAEMVLFLIDNHLQMSRTAQRRDLDDGKVIQRFAKLVKDEKHLVMLYLFTFADMRAVGRGVWSDWNAALLWELYAKTSQLLKGEYEADRLQLTAIQDEVSKLIGRLVDAKSIQKHFDTMPQGQLLSSNPDEIAKHITLIEKLTNSLGLKPQPIVLACSLRSPTPYGQKETQNYSQIIVVCARDKLGLFSKIAGVLASQNINILSAQVNTREDGIVLDILNVTDGNAQKSISAQKCQRAEALLKSVLMGEKDVESLLSRQEFSNNDKPVTKATIAPEIAINNDDSDTCTIIDVQAEDRIGLLYTISRVFYQLRLNIHLAKISTKGRRAVDVFYVQNENGYKILNQEKLHEIKTVLEEALIRTSMNIQKSKRGLETQNRGISMRFFIVILCILSFLFASSCGKDKQIEIGKELLRSGRFMEAKAHFENVTRIQPQNAKAHYQLGQVYYASEQYQKAVEQYKQALSIQPRNPETQIAMGEALLFGGQRLEALRIFLQALQPSGKKRRIKNQYMLKIAGLVGDAFHISQLTRTDTDNCFPSFSPDGRYIAFTSYRDENGEIYIMNADGAEQKRLTIQPYKNDYGPGFSADSKKILFAASDDRLSQASVVLQSDGSDARSELFYLTDISGNQMIPLMNNPSTIGNPVFSPDGKQIAFDANTGGNLDIYLMDADGKNRRRITTNPADDGQPAFSPDGKYIAFVSRRDDNYELYMMDVDGSNQRRLTYTLADEYDPAFSPDGKKLAYVSAKGHDLELILLDLKTKEPLQLTKTPGANINPAFSPDGKLAFASDRTDYLEIYLMDLRHPVSQAKLIAKIKKMIYRESVE